MKMNLQKNKNKYQEEKKIKRFVKEIEIGKETEEKEK